MLGSASNILSNSSFNRITGFPSLYLSRKRRSNFLCAGCIISLRIILKWAQWLSPQRASCLSSSSIFIFFLLPITQLNVSYPSNLWHDATTFHPTSGRQPHPPPFPFIAGSDSQSQGRIQKRRLPVTVFAALLLPIFCTLVTIYAVASLPILLYFSLPVTSFLRHPPPYRHIGALPQRAFRSQRASCSR